MSGETTTGRPSVRRVLQRFVTPVVDQLRDTRVLYAHGLLAPIDRFSGIVPEHQVVSFGSYFNAFPAAYWRRWTNIQDLQLRLRLRGGGQVTVLRSTAKGMSWVERKIVVEGDDLHEVMIELPLEPFIDGGWYWFDLVAHPGGDLLLEGADWSALTTATKRGSVTIGITTYNRPDYCVAQIRCLSEDAELVDLVDRVLVIDQGSERVDEHPDFNDAAKGLGERLTVIRQPNLGGSGGFARAMHEALKVGDSTYLLLLDDDIILEPEGVIRAAAFADLARRPVVVGGHMFSTFMPTVLHAYGETIDEERWMWGPAPGTEHSHDFAAKPLAHTPWLHRRVDVDYNGWWMCLVPLAALKRIGLAMPMFIKWDDADFGLRAQEAGIPTVTLPGTAVWHVPWHEKDDTVDWQAYYHERNRLLCALLHSPYRRGGKLPLESFELVIKHALAMQYSPAEMVLMAVEDILEGPSHLHRDLPTKLAELRILRSRYNDSRLASDLDEYPTIRRRRPDKRAQATADSKRSKASIALRSLPRQLLPASSSLRLNPEAALPHGDHQWWRLAQYDSVLVSSADGSSAAWHRREPALFRSLMARNSAVHARLYREWTSLARRYRDAVPALTSPEEWDQTFRRAESAAPQSFLDGRAVQHRDTGTWPDPRPHDGREPHVNDQHMDERHVNDQHTNDEHMNDQDVNDEHVNDDAPPGEPARTRGTG